MDRIRTLEAQVVTGVTRGAAVELRNVSKHFRTSSGAPWRRRVREKVALHRTDLSVAPGGITGIIGMNGSGKSTLIRILATLMLPDTGSASVFGFDVVRDAAVVRRHINRVSVEAAFFKSLSPWENLVYAARLYGSNGDARARAETALTRLGLPLETLDRPMKQLSRGQQQKVAIARSFLTTPSLLLMDEPTTGLDPHSKREVQQVIRMLRDQRDVTVLLCTHDLGEAEALCERVVILDGGRVLADDAPAALCARLATESDNGHPPTLEDAFLRLVGRRLDEDVDTSEDDGHG
jgi:ABC-2 type transport system ATP-binding protein